MVDNSKADRIKLALEAYKNSFFSSKNAAAKAYDAPLSTFKTQVNGTTCRQKTIVNGQKLTPTEEKTLTKLILDTSGFVLALFGLSYSLTIALQDSFPFI